MVDKKENPPTSAGKERHDRPPDEESIFILQLFPRNHPRIGKKILTNKKASRSFLVTLRSVATIL